MTDLVSSKKMGAERELVPPARSITTSKEQREYARNLKNFQ